MSFKNLSAPRIEKVFGSKNEASAQINNYVQNNRHQFIDGCLISFKYRSESDPDKIYSSLAIVNKDDDNNTASITLQTPDKDSIIILPNDNNENALWLDEDDSTDILSEIKYELDNIRLDIDNMKSVVDIHDYAFKRGLDSGELYNSAMFEIENSAEPIKPDGVTESDSEIIEIEPDYSGFTSGNVAHIMIKFAKTEDEIKKFYKRYLCDYELIWCQETKGLYINNNGTLVKINTISESGGDGGGSTSTVVEGIDSSDGAVNSIKMRNANNIEYVVKVNEKGNVSTNENSLESEIMGPSSEPDADGCTAALFLPKLYINMVYCGGLDGESGDNAIVDKHSYNYCSHNFVELSNLTGNDINLNGLSLQYAKDGTSWEVLPLFGKIKNGSTFLIRGAQCSVMDANTTKIKVNNYDMEWIDSKTGKPIQFSEKSAKFYLTYGTENCGVANPNLYSTAQKIRWGYIDLVGFNGDIVTDGYEKTAFTGLNNNRIMTKYYTMDSVKQATKELKARNNANDWTFVDLSKENGEVIPNINDYTPKASFENKSIFFNKSKIDGDSPSIISCSFGIQATDNGSGATRCFNWVSKGYYDEWVWISDNAEITAENALYTVKSFNGETDKSSPLYYYNRIRMEATDGTPFTVHKAIVKGIPSGTYYYKAGRSLELSTDVHKFTVFTDDEVNSGFTFVQSSDQQGFNWDEYQVWKYAADKITEEHPAFMINTGDMTQNGNRINEWIDYFDAKGGLSNIEEMATIGNNDLCPTDPFTLGAGEDKDKLNPINITYFYTFEIDENNPCIFNVSKLSEDGSVIKTVNNIYVPSLYSFNYGNTHFICVNSEITQQTESAVFGIDWSSATNKGYIYEKVKGWCEKDIELYGSSANWNIAYCHEMPFTILTEGMITAAFEATSSTVIRSGGSKLNDIALPGNEFWFSKFCQNNNIRLVIGGHKHTEAASYPIRENTDTNIHNNTMKPIIQIVKGTDGFGESTAITELVTITDESSDLYGQSFPQNWFVDLDNKTLNSNKEKMARLCTFELVDAPEEITAPVYAMSQATGYKHTSNKELPGKGIPWLKFYYEQSGTVEAPAANGGQKYPFYTVWQITENEITGTVKRVRGIMSKGKFNINIQGTNIKNGEAYKNDESGYISENQHKITIKK